jgi:hypothetical protein
MDATTARVVNTTFARGPLDTRTLDTYIEADSCTSVLTATASTGRRPRITEMRTSQEVVTYGPRSSNGARRCSRCFRHFRRAYLCWRECAYGFHFFVSSSQPVPMPTEVTASSRRGALIKKPRTIYVANDQTALAKVIAISILSAPLTLS